MERRGYSGETEGGWERIVGGGDWGNKGLLISWTHKEQKLYKIQ